MNIKLVIFLVFSVLNMSYAETNLFQPTPEKNTIGTIKQYERLPKVEVVESMMHSIQEGFDHGFLPKLIKVGSSGTYLLPDKNDENKALFKPFDEEWGTPNNPKGIVWRFGDYIKDFGIYGGESAAREAAAYLLDSKDGESAIGVPPTTFAVITHPYFSNKPNKDKLIKNNPFIPIDNYRQYTGEDRKTVIKYGSLQEFIPGCKEASDFDPKLFPDEEVRRIAIFDLRIFNTDRHTGNIIVKEVNGSLKLFPIDHGFTFPDNFGVKIEKNHWAKWSHVKKPWTMKELDYISQINPKEDAENIAKYFKFRDICLRNFRIAETVLKRLALDGYPLYDITEFMYRIEEKISSELENLVTEAEDAVESDRYNDETFFKVFEELLDHWLAN